MPPMTNAERLRAYLGERIPAGGDEADTLFTENEITDLRLYFSGPDANMYLAAAEGWSRKAAIYADLADQMTAGTNEALGTLHGHALKQVDFYFGLAAGRRQARVGRIRRPGTRLT